MIVGELANIHEAALVQCGLPLGRKNPPSSCR